MPNMQAKKRTARSVLSAKAFTTESGMMLRMNCVVLGSWAPPVFAVIDDSPLASTAGSMLKPWPGLKRSAMTTPKASAKVVTTSK